ncbi:hypothetical protein PC113_g10717 [Phytophthora cactorum]|uniref:Uncharacterized protein n=1 Tax=Phytophthora cactorum TaxID=29920 RepID=A0A8T0Z5A4_9STRA|nr:hypothetical protein PC113_g10717 [Phytophthora cactorum]
MEVDSLLRPRSNTSSAPEATEEPGAVVLPHHGGVPPSGHALPPSSGGRWLPRLLLVGGAVYAVAMLAWSSQNLNVVRTGSDSAASESNVPAFDQQAKQQQEGSGMDLAAILKAANDQETDAQQAQEKQQNNQETEEDTATYEVTPIPTQAAIDIPMEATQVREALRLAREAVVAKMEGDGSMSSLPSASGSQMSDEVRREQEAEEQARDALLLPKGETKPRNLKCLGWKSTGGCSPYGPRKPKNDFSCTKMVPHGHSGYCEVEDTDTGERFRVMRRYCSSSKWDMSFRCSDASNFVNFHYKAREAADNALTPGFTLPNIQENATDKQDEKQRDEIDYRTRAIARSRKKAEIRTRYRNEGKEIPPWSELDALVQAEETPAPTIEPPESDGYPDSIVWTHLLSFNPTSKQENYYVKTYNADPEFPKSQNCYGERNVSKSEHFYAQEVADLPFSRLETDLRRFAAEAVEIKKA